MATCEKCNNKYYSKECPHCKKIAWENKINKNNEIKYKKNNISIKPKKQKIEYGKIKNENKTIKISIVIIAICITLTTTYYFIQEYQKKQELNKITKLLYGTDDYEEIEKINKKLEEQNEKIMKQFRKIYLPK